jgi:hypothetical protein
MYMCLLGKKFRWVAPPSKPYYALRSPRSISGLVFSKFVGSSWGFYEGFNNYFGTGAGNSNTTGQRNNFFGSDAGRSNVSGSYNNFFGSAAGITNIAGNYNSFFGNSAGAGNTTGTSNSFFGDSAGYSNTVMNGRLGSLSVKVSQRADRSA